MWLNWFHRASHVNRPSPGRKSGRPRRRPPTLEALEARLVPAFNLTIGSGTTVGVTEAPTGTFTASAPGAFLSVGDVRASLLAGNDVTISSGTTGSENGDITWDAGSDLNYSGASNRQLTIVTGDNTTGEVSLSANLFSTAGPLSVGITATKSIVLKPGSSINAAGGTINLQANSGGQSGDFVGINVDGASLKTSGTGTISLTGRGGNALSANDPLAFFDVGVLLEDGATVSATGSGDITLQGIGGQGNTLPATDPNASFHNAGVRIESGTTVSATGSGGITLQGTGGTGAFENFGVEVLGPASGTATTVVQSVNGPIQISGTGGQGTDAFNEGVLVARGGQVRSQGTASIAITGTGGTGSNQNGGVDIETANADGVPALVTSAAGPIRITGYGGQGIDTGAAAVNDFLNDGVVIFNSGQVASPGTGANAAPITIQGHGGSGDASNNGVDLQGDGSATATQAVTSVDGPVRITGWGGSGPKGFSEGVVLFDGAQVLSTGASPLTLTGYGGTGTDDNIGVEANTDGSGAPSEVVAQAGAPISITGYGAGSTDSHGNPVGSATGRQNVGVAVFAGGLVTSTTTSAGAAPVTITGYGGSGTSQNVGVAVDGTTFDDNGNPNGMDTTTQVTSVTAPIRITGWGGRGTGQQNVGLGVVGGGQVTSTGTGPSAAPITLQGYGGRGIAANFGVAVGAGSAAVTSKDGDIQLSGTAGTGFQADEAIAIAPLGLGTGSVTSNGNGGVTLTGDSLRLDPQGTVSTAASPVWIQPATASTAINLGGGNGAGTLGISDAALARISAPVLLVGNTADSGNVTVSGALSHTSGFHTLQADTGGSITVSAAIASNGGNVVMHSGPAGIIVNATINTSPGSGGTLVTGSNVTLNTAPTLGAGNIFLNAAPVVAGSVVIDDGSGTTAGQVTATGQHSMERRLTMPLTGVLPGVDNGQTFTFTANTTITIGGLQLSLARLLGGNFTVQVQYLIGANGLATLTLTFAGGSGASQVLYGSLADGRYQLSVNGQVVASFYRLFGDVNGDGQVDDTDLAAFRAAYRSRRGMPNYRSYFDYNGDGSIDSVDYFQFLRRYRTRINADGSITSF